MKRLYLGIFFICCSIAVNAQPVKPTLYDLIKSLVADATGYENVGDWAVGNPKKFAVKWKEDKITMSDDTSINFFRIGIADVTINGRSFMQVGQPVKWNVMLKGPRSGYTSFSIVNTPLSPELQPKYTIDSIFGKSEFKAKLLKKCDGKTLAGYYYYEVKLPKKDPIFMKLSWVWVNGNTGIRIDCFDNFSKYAAKLDCAQ
jgi:hypothetical protein